MRIKNTLKLCTAAALAIATVGSANAATIVNYEFTAGSLVSTDDSTNWVTSLIDITSNATSSGQGSFDTTSVSGALTYNWFTNDGNVINLNNFASFTIAADLGFDLTLTEISFRAYTNTNPSGFPTVYFRSDADGFANNLVAQDLPKLQSVFVDYSEEISVTVLSGSFREFRLYFDGGNAGNANKIHIDDIRITGTSTVIPEPASLALLGLGSVLLLSSRRRG